MLKFDNTHIFTGYIKQLLSSFNLPKYRIYTNDNELIKTIRKQPGEKFPDYMQYIPYIKNDTLQYYLGVDENKKPIWEDTSERYYYNKKVLNKTKTLEIKNNKYDYYVHEYLGEYLRFKRDYNNFDLMSLYNCFSNRICNNVYYNWTTRDIDDNGINITFDSSDSNYRIYMLPVKLFKKYTIAIDSDSPVEFCCGIYGKYQDSREKVEKLPEITYEKHARLSFNQPILFTKIAELPEYIKEENTAELAKNEHDLKLFIKLPAANTSSIVVLEGDYLNWNKQNKFITNFEGPIVQGQHIGYQENQLFKPIDQLQLLTQNTNESYPFADKLIEYLSGNAITNEEEISDNITRAQKVMALNNHEPELEGLWESKIRHIIYNYIKDKKCSKYDTLGYIDKEAETNYSSKEPNKVTIANIDIYEEGE